jgi:hypothetical protein
MLFLHNWLLNLHYSLSILHYQLSISNKFAKPAAVGKRPAVAACAGQFLCLQTLDI